MPPSPGNLKQVTCDPGGHMLTNIGVWSPDSQWIAYDRRRADDVFDGRRIERVHVKTGDVQVLYESAHGACCGVVTCSPTDDRLVFIHGPENPTPDWSYAACHRRGMLVRAGAPGRGETLDARDLTEPGTPGALRGGSHLHVFSGDGQWVSFTYEDHLLAACTEERAGREVNLRNVGVSAPAGPVTVSRAHPRNHDGAQFSVLVSQTVANPEPGSDQVCRACEEAWVGADGYLRPDGTRQHKALAFQGHVRARSGERLSELFLVDLPGDLARAGPDGPLQGTATTRPRPPAGARQRRLTHTEDRAYPGLQGPRHWPRSAPDGARIAFLMKDEKGVVQVWTVTPHGGRPIRVTGNPWDVASAFSWSPDGRLVAYIMDRSVFVTEVDSGQAHRLTPRVSGPDAPRPYACVVSPAGGQVAYTRPVSLREGRFDQVFVVDIPPKLLRAEPP